MGFSVSASFSILVVASFIAVGILYPAVSNGFEEVTDAQDDAYEGRLAAKHTEIVITEAQWHDDVPTDYVSVSIRNNGSTALSVDETDVLLDNEYQDTYSHQDVDGDTDTDLWLPGETLYIEINRPLIELTPPQRVKVVSGPGIADSSEVV